MRANPELQGLAERYFARAEVSALAGLPDVARNAAFFNAWTRKEAIVKATGRGLSTPLDAFEVSLAPGAPPALLRWDGAAAGRGRSQLEHLEPRARYVGALAIYTPGRNGSMARGGRPVCNLRFDCLPSTHQVSPVPAAKGE